jgi:hypothetical protein
VTASLQASPWARVIKASDFTDNAVGLIHTTGPMLPRLAGKYGPPVLRELILRPDTPLDADVKERIARQLDSAAGRFATIWHGPDCPVPSNVSHRGPDLPACFMLVGRFMGPDIPLT